MTLLSELLQGRQRSSAGSVRVGGALNRKGFTLGLACDGVTLKKLFSPEIFVRAWNKIAPGSGEKTRCFVLNAVNHCLKLRAFARIVGSRRMPLVA